MLKKLVPLFVCLFFFSLNLAAQNSPAVNEALRRETIQNSVRQEQIDKRRSMPARQGTERVSVSRANVESLYRQKKCNNCPKSIVNQKVLPETVKLIAPPKEVFAEYAEFLKQKNTGVIKLFSDQGCAEGTSVVKIDGVCGNLFEVLGYGTNFSFRTGKYVLRQFADIIYRDRNLTVSANLTFGMMTSIGFNQVENISSNTSAVNTLRKYNLPKDIKELEAENKILEKGVTINNLLIKKSFPIREGETFLLRSAAFLYKTEWVERGWNVFDNSVFDERKDVIVVLQIAKVSADETTFVWKTLEEKKAPKIKVSKEDKKRIIEQEQRGLN